MDTCSVKGYCTYIFDQAGVNFWAWWNSDDPELRLVPSEAAASMPNLVIERAERICELRRSAA